MLPARRRECEVAQGALRPETSRVASVAVYSRRRSRLLEVLDGLERCTRKRGDIGQADLLKEASRRLREGRFTLVVLGEFKRGKSTLVNALLDADVMPVGVTPLTSAAVTIEHGEEGALVRLHDGQEEAVALGDLAEFATERGNPRNEKGVQRVSIRCPASLLEHGVVLVDTPGVGSIHQHNTEAVYRYLPEADAVIFVLSVDPPASKAELAFLHDVRAQVSRIFFLLNKADQLSEAELVESLAFVRRALAAGADLHDVKVFPVSARERDEGFQEFQRELEMFLSEGRGIFLLERAEERARSSLNESRMAIDLEERSLELSIEELESRSEALEQRLEEVERKRWGAEHHLDADVKTLIADYLDPALEHLGKEGSKRVRAAIGKASAEGRATRSQMEAQIKEEIRGLAAEWIGRLETELAERLGKLDRSYADEANRLSAELHQLSAELFGITISRVDVQDTLELPSRFSFRLEDQLMGVELIALGLRQLLPGGLGRRLALRDALRKADEMVDRHRGRLRYDLIQRIQEQQRLLKSRLAEVIAASESTVRGSISRASEAHKHGVQSMAQEKQRLQSYRADLDYLEEALVGAASLDPRGARAVIRARGVG